MNMKRLTFVLFSISLIFSIQSAFAGPFGIDMGMSLAEVKQVCKMAPKHIQDNVYEITPPKTNDMFETYYVRIDPDYGVYWLKAIGKDIYTNGHGERLISTFEMLVASIRKTYGEESYRDDSLVDGSIWKEPKEFMYALLQGDRKLDAIWSKQFDLMQMLLNDTAFIEKMRSSTEDELQKFATDTVALRDLGIIDRIAEYKKLPEDISIIGVFSIAETASLGRVMLEYSFSNSEAVDAKADSVF